MKKGTFIIGMFSFVSGFYLGGKILVDIVNESKRNADKNMKNMLIFDNWLNQVYSGKSIEDFFHKNSYQKIIIYGYGYVGARLRQALERTDLDVAAVMDMSGCGDNEFIGGDAEIPEADCIVITPMNYYDEIYEMLSKKTKVPIVSINEVLACDR